jgi:DNA-binding protein HU-beta
MAKAKNSKVTKTQLISELAESNQISNANAERFLNSFIEIVTNNLKKGNEVAITGFGTFKKTKRKARKGVNPKTRESINIPASTTVSFKTGKTLKDSV